MKLAINGWPLFESPYGPLATHLMGVVERILELDPELNVLLLGAEGRLPPHSRRAEMQVHTRQNSVWDRLRFEQWEAARAASQAGADLYYVPYPAAPLRASLPVVVQVDGQAVARRRTVLERLRRALGWAGIEAAALRTRSADLAGVDLGLPHLAGSPSGQMRMAEIPAWVPDQIAAVGESQPQSLRQRYGLDSGYVLCHGLQAVDVAFCLASWTWVDGAVGDTYPLLFLGLNPEVAAMVRRQAQVLNVQDSIQIVDAFDLAHLGALYRAAEAFLMPGWDGCGHGLRWALASGLPIAGVEAPPLNAILGPAGYLTAADDARALGAACLTLLVEADVARPLRETGLLRARSFRGDAPLLAFLKCLKQYTGGAGGC